MISAAGDSNVARFLLSRAVFLYEIEYHPRRAVALGGGKDAGWRAWQDFRCGAWRVYSPHRLVREKLWSAFREELGTTDERECAVGVAQDFAVRAPVAKDVHGVAVIQPMHGGAVGVAVDEEGRAGVL